MNYLCNAFEEKTSYRAFSSAGSEHLPYKQRVGGSNPSTPTKKSSYIKKLLLFLFSAIPDGLKTYETHPFH